MEKKLVVLTAVFALTAGFVFAQEMPGTEPAADAAITEPVDAMTTSDLVSNEVMANEEFYNEEMDITSEEVPAEEAAPEATEAK